MSESEARRGNEPCPCGGNVTCGCPCHDGERVSWHVVPTEQAPEITDLEPYRTLADPTASRWLQDALIGALDRDPVDAANDAEYLATILAERCTALLREERSFTSTR